MQESINRMFDILDYLGIAVDTLDSGTLRPSDVDYELTLIIRNAEKLLNLAKTIQSDRVRTSHV